MVGKLYPLTLFLYHVHVLGCPLFRAIVIVKNIQVDNALYTTVLCLHVHVVGARSQGLRQTKTNK